MEMKDMSGEPRSNEEIQETIDALTKRLVTGPIDPIMVYYTTIIDALKELLLHRSEL